MRRLLIEVTTLVEWGLLGLQASVKAQLGSCGSQALGQSLTVVVLGLIYSAAYGIFPYQGSNLCLLHWQVDS